MSNETLAPVTTGRSSLMTRLRNSGEIVASVILAAFGHGRSLLNRLVAQAAAVIRTISYVRLTARTADQAKTLECLRQLESQALNIALHLGSPERKLRACLDIIRTAHAFGRDTGDALTAATQILQDRDYWLRKQNRVFTVTQLACAMAKLAAASRQMSLATEVYLWAQQYNAKVVDLDRRIALAVALSDVAIHLQAPCDQAAWLTVAMETASGIKCPAQRLEAVNFVARKMVIVGIPPATNGKEWRRFAVVDEPTLGTVDRRQTAAEPETAAPADDEDLRFDTVAG